MKESYIEDLVNHNGPESCVYCCKAIDEALTGVHIGRVLSRENKLNQDADVVVLNGKQNEQKRYDEFLLNPARSETSSMYGNPMHENREIPFSPTYSTNGDAWRTCWKGEEPKPTMHENGKSDNPIVPMKQLNKGATTPEEIVEGRGLTKGNANQQNMHRTQGRKNAMSNELERIRFVARQNKDVKFTALSHHITIERLREAFLNTKKKVAPGIDGETWKTYAENLEENLKNLHKKVHNGGYKAKPARRVYIPKSGGKIRPLGVASLEDKILQKAVTKILNAIYEVDFLGFSYGYRPNRSPHQALDALAMGLRWKKVSWVLDADISGFYDNINHEWMMKFINHRIADTRISRLVKKWLSAGVM
ncbi:MAG: group II intron reverse transcriptase/maturase, partial [Alphaproteobacteria bacterium]|nr:group II intron reverse transcriptase/maturase [Alphaproteobacteria bacterium]MBP9692489.1 group II intron reverse transcriptase/maturase [Alphaproteobacteria bacterium]